MWCCATRYALTIKSGAKRHKVWILFFLHSLSLFFMLKKSPAVNYVHNANQSLHIALFFPCAMLMANGVLLQSNEEVLTFN